MSLETKIISCGSYLPKKILTNDELAKKVDTNDEWITSRTGIKQRHIAADDEYTSDLGYKAAKDALEKANMQASEIDAIIVATTTPDNVFPSVATKIQHKLGIKDAFAFDVQAVCSGFVYGLTIADKFIKTSMAKNILVIGAEKLSKILDWSDRNTCVLFGDGAGAVIASQSDGDSKIIDTNLHSDGKYFDILYTDGGPAINNQAAFIRMQGKEVFKNAVSKMSNSIISIIEKNDLTINDIDLIIPHQANNRILMAIKDKTKISEEKVMSTVAKHANSSAASIPLALSQALEENVVKRSDMLVLTALGAGLTWGSILLKW
jgi:3-oxoacyl-[acyl-carrier-protein] synthase III